MGSPTGSLSLPVRGPVYLDSNSLIYSVERIEPFIVHLDPIWQAAEAGRFIIVSSELAIPETLAKPIRDGDYVVEALFRALFDSRDVDLISATRDVWETTARIRGETGRKTPDALHAATALLADCTLFVTNDADFRRVPGLPAVILGDLVEQAGL